MGIKITAVTASSYRASVVCQATNGHSIQSSSSQPQNSDTTVAVTILMFFSFEEGSEDQESQGHLVIYHHYTYTRDEKGQQEIVTKE